MSYFNPRTPDGVRLTLQGSFLHATTISIHAPLTGCDGEPRKLLL